MRYQVSAPREDIAFESVTEAKDLLKNFSVPQWQEALQCATETMPTTAEFDDAPLPATVFTPHTHIRALRPDTLLVSGARGAGKTFWTRALQQKDIRKMLEQDVPELTNVRICVGYTNAQNPKAYPSPVVCSNLLTKYKPNHIWQAVWIRALASQQEVTSPCPCSCLSWEEDAATVANNPEKVDSFLYKANEELNRAGTRVLVLFDALDRSAESWEDIDALTTSLLQMTLQISTFNSIKGKIFLREDHCNRLQFAFPDSSKLLANKVDLSWKRHELYGMLWKRLCNSTGVSGELLRTAFNAFFPKGLEQKDGNWIFSRNADLNDENLRLLFHFLTGPYMGKDRRRGIPYVWTVGHLADARQQTSPRSFLAAIRSACDDSRVNHKSSEYAIHYDSIKHGVQEASRIRVDEMNEDNPWAEGLLDSLRGLTVPCSFIDIQKNWTKRYPKGPKGLVDQYGKHVPPEFVSQNWIDVKNMLERLGFCQTMSDGRFNMPDLYRVGFGLGRRGGVKPLK